MEDGNVVRIDPDRPDPGVVERAAELLRAGQIVAIPTETVYGLAANALDPRAVTRIFEAKGRPAFNPLIVHIADAEDLDRVARDVSAVAHELAKKFWPGPLTLVLRRQPIIPDVVTAGLDTVGVRVPAHAVMRAVIRASALPLAAPSANLFTRVSPTTAAHVAAQLADRVPLILDAGPTAVGIESTVVDLTTSPPRLLRPGGTPRDAIEAVTGPLAVVDDPLGDEARPSPGMVERHYAPRTVLRMFSIDERSAAMASAASLRSEGHRVVVVARERFAEGVQLMPREADAFARELYVMLHELEDAGIEVAFVEEVPSDSSWDAVRDRLRRASTP